MSYSEEDKLRRDLDSMALYIQHLEGQIWEIKRSSKTVFTSREQEQYVNELLTAIKQRESTISELSCLLDTKKMEISNFELKIKQLRSDLQYMKKENIGLAEVLHEVRIQQKPRGFFSNCDYDYDLDTSFFELRAEIRRLRYKVESKDKEIASLNKRLSDINSHMSLKEWFFNFFS